MADASAYQGSQAFSQGSIANESVTSNTGSLTLSKAIVALRGIHDGVGLTVNLAYSGGSQGLLGLPAGWGFGIAFLVPGESLSTQGKTSIIDPHWSDAAGYQSGLRYVNNHGMKFQDIIPPQPLRSGRPGTYAYTLRYTDGAMDYFDATGKLVEHADIFGNALSYYYTDPFAGAPGNRLDHIVDSFGQQVRFGYGPNAIVVTTPDGARCTINWSAQGVQNVVDALGNLTSFSYQPSASHHLVTAVQYPTGLTTRFDYVGLTYLDAAGAPQSFAAVSDMVHLDASGKQLDHTSYAFGTDSGGATFTGAAAGYRLNSGADSLMDSNNAAYVYDVLIRRIDDAGKAASASRIYYNYLHLPLREEHYLVAPDGAVAKGYRALYTYVIDPDYHARTPTYAQPVGVEQFVYDDGAQAYRALRKSLSSYDVFGQLLSSEELLYDAAQKAYVSQLQSTLSYSATSWGGELPALETHADRVSGYQRQIAYALSADGKTIQTATVRWRADGGAAWSPWKTRTSRFDAQGRVLAETLAWSPGAVVPPGSVASATSTRSYDFDAARRRLAVTAVDPLGNAATTSYDVGIVHGPVVATRLPLGQTSTARYDALGRVVATIDALGHQTVTAYTIGKDGNSVTSTGPTGYLVRQDFDALGRLVAVRDNGDPTGNGGAAPNRVLRTSSHDMLGRVARASNELGLAMQYQYDGLGRVVQRTDPLGNRHVTRYLDGQLATEEYLNGIQRSRSELDGAGRTVSLSSYPDPGDAAAGFARRLDTAYDGFGLVRSKQLYSQSLADDSLVLLQQVEHVFDVEAALSGESFSGRLGSQVDVQRSHVYELSGQAVQHLKTTTYADERRFTDQSDGFVFDAAGRLVSAVNALGQSENYAYDGNGRLARRVRYDGTAFAYAYDDKGQQLSMSWPGGAVSHSYLANGRTAGVQMGGAAMRFEYALDGSASAIVYPDGSRQTYVLDAASRVTGATDASGATSSIAYDQLGRIAARSHGADTLSYQYATVNHGFGVHVGDSLAGPAAKLLRKLAFDGFGQLAASSSTDRDGRALLSSSYARDALGRVSTIRLASQTACDPAVNCVRSAIYDGINQLVSSTTAPADAGQAEVLAYVYDGNYNVLSRSENGTPSRYTYNALGQLTSGGVRYDANGRMVADGMGASYAYNALDQMVSATVGGATVGYAYHPDGALGQRSTGSAAQGFYYDSGAINAVSAGAPNAGAGTAWTSFLLDATLRRGAYGDGAPGYYLAGLDSTALLQGQDGAEAIGYDPYGAAQGGAGFGAERNFTWNQEYTDPATRLVYLRTRSYHPLLMRFCSMDSVQQDNRYAYARGNPLNLADPSGHMDTAEILGFVAGAVVGLLVTVATVGAATPVAAAIFGAETVGASVSAGAVAGAAGAIAGDATSAAITHQEFTAQRALIDLFAGALGGGIGASVGDSAGSWAMRAATARGMSERAIGIVGKVCSFGVGGGTSKVTSTSANAALSAIPFTGAGSTLSRVAAGAGAERGGMLRSGAYLGRIQASQTPVPFSDAQASLSSPAHATLGALLDRQLFAAMPQAGGQRGAPGARSGQQAAASASWEAIAVQGAGSSMFSSAGYSPDGTLGAAPAMAGMAAQPAAHAGAAAAGQAAGPMAGFGAFSSAQAIAAFLQRPVFGGYPSIDRFSFAGTGPDLPG